MKQVIQQASNVVTEREFNGMSFKFREDGYFNMTHASKNFGKHIDDFFRLDGTKTYLVELAKSLAPADVRELGWGNMVKDARGVTTDIVHGNRYIADRGTWAHPKLAVFFARWLDVKFAVFCDMVIDDLMHGHSVLTVVAPEKAMAPKLPQTYIESLQELIESIKEQERLQALVHQKDAILIEQAPKVAYIDKYIEDAGSLGIRAASKVLQCNERELGHWLVDQKLAHRSNPTRTLTPYATAENRGLLKLTTGMKYGSEGVFVQMRITSKGMTYLRENLPAYVYKTYK